MSHGPMIQCEQLTMRYGDGPAVLNALDWSVEQGDAVAVVGPSGCGKSTLLNLLGTLDYPTTGRILINGQDTAGLSEKELASLRAERIGFVFQDHHLLPQLAAVDNILLPTLSHGTNTAFEKERAEELLGRVGLADHARKRPGQMSGGQRQRVAIVRALINQPDVLLVDEPTGALDEHAADEVVDLLAQLNAERGVTLVMVTHAPQLASRMNQVFRLADGKMVSDDAA